jgi:aminopeptidase YwaD
MKDLLNKYLKTICEEIGARPTGSLENQRAVSYLAMCLREYGFEVVLDSFNCMDWVNEGAVLKLGDEAVEVLASDYSAPLKGIKEEAEEAAHLVTDIYKNRKSNNEKTYS